ncbi:MAG: excinuclease ABC subunit UvrC [Ruminococcaceae bacterium]|nr:excinuclease ABC subunit UvrC [Oscillospiraceae bacterium]
MELKELRAKANALPMRPGVYQMKDRDGVIIYVGKAKKLRNRVSSYFLNTGNHGIKTETMLSHVDNFEVIITTTEWEALVLENTLIKRHMPKYNILLKDDKGYPFIRVDTRLPYVSFSLVPAVGDDGARYFGPYRGRTVAHEVIDIVTSTFRLPTCKRSFPKDIGRDRPCLNYQLGKCVGVCTGIPYEEYRALVDQAVMLLEGSYEKLARELRQEMEDAAEALEFEKAARLRDRLRALEKVGDRQKVVAARAPDTDIIGFYAGSVKSCAVVLHYMGGTLYAKDVQMLDAADESEIPALMDDFIKRYYENAADIPREIVCSTVPEDQELTEQWLESIAGHKVSVMGPGRDRKRFTNMAYVNARDEAERATARKERQAKIGDLLQKMLSLSKKPNRIEAYDISNTAGEDTVGAMVVFENARPKRNSYRKFKIRDLEGQNDYAAMAQMLTRRFKHLLEGDEKFSVMPDLILIDGGVGHVHAALEAIRAMGVQCEVRGMVKDSRHRTRAIVDEFGQETGISTNPAVFSFIGTIQEEVHRFVISYHRNLRDSLHSMLDEIDGIGPKRRDALLAHYKSIDAIRTADLHELERFLPKSAAASVYRFFHNEDG